jgi:hypothetical protein
VKNHGTPAWLIAAAAAVIVRLAIAIPLLGDGAASSVDFDRFWLVGTSSARPYIEARVEYMPLAVGLFTALAPATGSRIAFGRTMVGLAVAADIGIATALLIAFGGRAAMLYALVTLPILNLSYSRIDLLPTLAVVVAVGALSRSRPLAAVAALLTGVALKIWPLPLAALLVRAADRRVHRTAMIALGLLGPAMLLTIWHGAAGSRGLLQIATFRGATGWQIESIVGNAVMVLAGRRSLRFEAGAARIGYLTSGMTAGCLLVGTELACGLAWIGAGVNRVGVTWLSCVGLLLMWSPLLSPQFMIWLSPAAAIAWIEGDYLPASCAAVAIALTGAYWPHYMEILNGSRWVYAITARNIALCAMVLAACAALRTRPRLSSSAELQMRIALPAIVIALTGIALFLNTAPARSIGERYHPGGNSICSPRSCLRELDDDLDVIRLPCEGPLEFSGILTPCHETGEPRAVRVGQHLRRLVPVSLVGVDAAHHDVVSQHDVGCHIGHREPDGAPAGPDAREAHDTAGRDGLDRIGYDLPHTGAFDDHVWLQGKARDSAGVVRGPKGTNELRLGPRLDLVKDVDLESVLPADQRRKKADRPRAGHEHDARLPERTMTN